MILVFLALDPGSLACSFSHVIELGSSNVALANELDLLNERRMKRESLFYANAGRDSSDSEGLADAAVLLLEHIALEDLDSFSVAFLDLDVYLNGIAYGKLRNIVLFIFLSDGLYEIHFVSSFLLRGSWHPNT